MLVGVKFCGGCNPRYDRKKYLEEVEREHPSWNFQIAKEYWHYDLLLVICGCASCCASCEQYEFEQLVKVWEEKSCC